MIEHELLKIATELGSLLVKSGKKLATAESCTGGGIAALMTEIPGSSAWFDSAIVSYSNQAKHKLLGVPDEIIEQHGAVSEEVVLLMVSGLLNVTNAEVGVAVTGIAGPDGGSVEKPVGTVWIAWQFSGDKPFSQCFKFGGNRSKVRNQTIITALNKLSQYLTHGKIRNN